MANFPLRDSSKNILRNSGEIITLGVRLKVIISFLFRGAFAGYVFEIAKPPILVPCHVVKFLLLISKSGAADEKYVPPIFK